MLKFPKKSHRKIITIPQESVELAEFFGIIFGDGGINNDWQLVITLNSVADLEYSHYVRKLIEKLFRLQVTTKLRHNRNALLLVCSSTNLIELLVLKGAVKGNKVKKQIDTPIWISNNNEYKKAFLRGLMDTDGCLYIHNHSLGGKFYNNIGLCFTSFSERLIYSVVKIFQENDIKPYVKDKGRRIYLYSQKSVSQYLNIFQTSNPRIKNKFEEWKNLHINTNSIGNGSVA